MSPAPVFKKAITIWDVPQLLNDTKKLLAFIRNTVSKRKGNPVVTDIAQHN
jgi:hypothetical protein